MRGCGWVCGVCTLTNDGRDMKTMMVVMREGGRERGRERESEGTESMHEDQIQSGHSMPVVYLSVSLSFCLTGDGFKGTSWTNI